MARKLNFQTIPLAALPLKDRIHLGASPRPIVLIVDDEAVIADTRAMILEHSGISALVAYDGKSALEIAQMTPPDLLLTDVFMPGMNGVDLATAIRQIFPKCGILLFSGQASSVDLLNAAREAGQEFTILTKPLHPTELLARISAALTSQNRLKESGSRSAVARPDENAAHRSIAAVAADMLSRSAEQTHEHQDHSGC
jgi:DNA-binding response OmpR family regulator